MVWKSNLHTYDVSLYEAKVARESLNETGIEPHQRQSTGTSQITTTNASDQSILIDPRQSMAYNNRDENFQVLESEYIKQHSSTHTTSSPSTTNSSKSTSDSLSSNASSLLNFPKSKSSFFDDFTNSPNKKSLQNCSTNSSSKYF